MNKFITIIACIALTPCAVNADELIISFASRHVFNIEQMEKHGPLNENNPGAGYYNGRHEVGAYLNTRMRTSLYLARRWDYKYGLFSYVGMVTGYGAPVLPFAGAGANFGPVRAVIIPGMDLEMSRPTVVIGLSVVFAVN